MDTLRAGNEMSLDTRGMFEMVLLLVIMIMMMMMCGMIERVFLVISTIPSIFSKCFSSFILLVARNSCFYCSFETSNFA